MLVQTDMINDVLTAGYRKTSVENKILLNNAAQCQSKIRKEDLKCLLVAGAKLQTHVKPLQLVVISIKLLQLQP